jgi:hypothetical protein
MIPLGGGVLYNIPIEFCIPKKQLRLLKVCMNETYSTVRVGKNLSGVFTVRNGLKTDKFFHHCFGVFRYEGLGKSEWFEIKWYTSASGLCR